MDEHGCVAVAGRPDCANVVAAASGVDVHASNAVIVAADPAAVAPVVVGTGVVHAVGAVADAVAEWGAVLVLGEDLGGADCEDGAHPGARNLAVVVLFDGGADTDAGVGGGVGEEDSVSWEGQAGAGPAALTLHAQVLLVREGGGGGGDGKMVPALGVHDGGDDNDGDDAAADDDVGTVQLASVLTQNQPLGWAMQCALVLAALVSPAHHHSLLCFGFFFCVCVCGGASERRCVNTFLFGKWSRMRNLFKRVVLLW